MIRKLSVSNYRSIGADIEIRPAALSVLVGPNGSGKSNILDVLSFVRDATVQGLPAAISIRGGIDSVRRRSHGRPFDVRVELDLSLAQGEASYEFCITGDRKEEYRIKWEKASVSNPRETHHLERTEDGWKSPVGILPRMDNQSLALTALGGTEQFKPLADVLSGMIVYSIFPDTLRAPQKFDSTRPMKEHGENWVSVLRDLVKDEAAKNDLVSGLKKLTGDIEDIQIANAAQHLIARFKQQAKRTKGKRWFDASGQSDGTLRVAGLLTALLQNPRIPVIGIEEPELTVHPGALPMLVDYLHQASEVSQIIMTTHSPIALDVLDVVKDAVFVVERTEGETDVKKVGPEQLEPVRNRLLHLGDLFVSGDLQLSLFDAS